MNPTPDLSQGDFTLPGEAGYEQLTLRLAKKWGADTIRDSDGTQLSPEIVQSGYAIYSTLCLVRSVQPRSSLVLLGDDRQLPAVDAGQPFRDLVGLASGALSGHVVRLTRIDAREG